MKTEADLLITEEQIGQADADAAAAQVAATSAGAELEAQPFSLIAAQNHTTASQRAAQLAAYARELREQRTQQQEALRASQDRGTLEKAAAPQIKEAAEALPASRKRIEKAVRAAQDALVELFDAGLAHNALVIGHGEELHKRGLHFDADGLHENAGGCAGYGDLGRVRVKGVTWKPVGADPLVAWVVFRTAKARLGHNSVLGHTMEAWTRTPSIVDVHPADLLSRIPAPPVVPQTPPLPWLRPGDSHVDSVA